MYLHQVKNPVILGADGNPIKLTAAEKWACAKLQNELNNSMYYRMKNSIGYEVSITTLTSISKKISEQKLYQIPFADYVPVRVGEGTWSSNITHYRTFNLSDKFETGYINVAGQSDRLAIADTAVDALNIKQFNWAKELTWSIFELEEAAKSGNWDLVSSKEEARKMNWDVGLQKIAFLGADGLNGSGGACLGLLNQAGVTNDTTTITQPISAMDTSALKAFTAAIVEKYRANSNRTAYPTHFIIPESDYNGLASQASPQFPIKSTLELLEETFQTITMNKQFKILPLAYADAAYSLGVLSKQTYTLLNYDEKSLVMNIGLDYTNTLANSINNFQFFNVGYGQHTGVLTLRPQELMYFSFTA